MSLCLGLSQAYVPMCGSKLAVSPYVRMSGSMSGSMSDVSPYLWVYVRRISLSPYVRI